MGREVVGVNDRLGTIALDCDGNRITVVEYLKYNNVVVEWPTGERKKTTWRHIQDSRIRKPEERVGTIHKDSEGSPVTVVHYNSSKEVVVEWVDGTRGTFDWRSLSSSCFKKPVESRLGQEIVNNDGEKLTVVNWVSSAEVQVQWADGSKSWHQWSHISRGSVRRPNKGVLGVGTISGRFPNDQDVMSAWRRMIHRVYDKKFTDKQTTYQNVTVSDELKEYVNFYEVYTKLTGYGNPDLNLDKDILSRYYGIDPPMYSRETLALVPRKVNSLVIPRGENSGYDKGWSVGAGYRVCYRGEYIGSFKTEDEAKRIYIQVKETDLKDTLDKYRDTLDANVVKALENWKF